MPRQGPDGSKYGEPSQVTSEWARDVEFGMGVSLVEPCNLYGCKIGDDCSGRLPRFRKAPPSVRRHWFKRHYPAGPHRRQCRHWCGFCCDLGYNGFRYLRWQSSAPTRIPKISEGSQSGAAPGSHQVAVRASAMILPSFGRFPGGTSSTLPSSFVTARRLAEIALRRGSVGDAASALNVMASASPWRVTTSRNRPSSGWPLAISAICSGRTNIPLTLVLWSARPIQPLIRMLVRPHALSPGMAAVRSPIASRIQG